MGGGGGGGGGGGVVDWLPNTKSTYLSQSGFVNSALDNLGWINIIFHIQSSTDDWSFDNFGCIDDFLDSRNAKCDV